MCVCSHAGAKACLSDAVKTVWKWICCVTCRLIDSLFCATSEQKHPLLIVIVCDFQTNLSAHTLVQPDKPTLKCFCRMHCRFIHLFLCTLYIMPSLSFTTVSCFMLHLMSSRISMPSMLARFISGGLYIIQTITDLK